jgi:hypothetical protein
MLRKIIVQDLKTKISYRGTMETDNFRYGEPLLVVLSGTNIPIAYQTPPIRGWLLSVDDASKLYLFDVNGNRYLLRSDDEA